TGRSLLPDVFVLVVAAVAVGVGATAGFPPSAAMGGAYRVVARTTAFATSSRFGGVAAGGSLSVAPVERSVAAGGSVPVVSRSAPARRLMTTLLEKRLSYSRRFRSGSTGSGAAGAPVG